MVQEMWQCKKIPNIYHGLKNNNKRNIYKSCIKVSKTTDKAYEIFIK